MIALLEVALVTATALAGVTWLLVVTVSPRVAAPGPAAGPVRRVLVARAWLTAPLWVPLVLIAAAMVPHLAGALSSIADHCPPSGGHHHHLCPVHPPESPHDFVGWALLIGLALPAMLLAAACARRVVTEWRLTRALVRTSRPSDLGADVRLLDQDEPIALTVGLWSPTVLVSRGLVAGLSRRALDVVLAHERAHIARRDARWTVLDRFAASLLPRSVAGPLLDRLSVAREQACDAAAARERGGVLEVARALAEVLRLRMATPGVGVSVSSGAVEARVAHLLEPETPARRRLWMPALVVVTVLAAGMGPLHVAIESVVSHLIH